MNGPKNTQRSERDLCQGTGKDLVPGPLLLARNIRIRRDVRQVFKLAVNYEETSAKALLLPCSGKDGLPGPVLISRISGIRTVFKYWTGRPLSRH